MLQLLDFLYEHSFDKQIYCLLAADAGDLGLTWRSAQPAHWELKQADSVAEVPREDLLAHLRRRGADVVAFEHEIKSLVAAHVVVADHVLRAAQDTLGSEGVQQVLRAQQEFVRELRAALEPLHPPRLRLVR